MNIAKKKVRLTKAGVTLEKLPIVAYLRTNLFKLD